MRILGISAFYHDSAACMVEDGRTVAAAQEERFTRKKHDESFPVNAVGYCIRQSGGGPDAVAFYDKPVRKFERILKTYFSVAPRGLRSAVRILPTWAKQKLWVPLEIEKALETCGVKMPDDLYFMEHHQSHAASAFFPSPFKSAAVLTIDGVGEWATSTIGRGCGNRIEIMKELRFPHSLGLLYSAFTYHTGFRVNSGEYKLMGLAPYGKPEYVDLILEKLVDVKDDGSFRMNMDYFGYLDGLTMTGDAFDELFGPPREPESEITQREMDMARSIQEVTEMIVIRMASHAGEITGEKRICMAGGVALNCVANGRLLREGTFADIWIQPAAGDAGGALGAALMVWHHVLGNDRHVDGVHDSMNGAYLGPEFPDDEIKVFLDENGYPARKLADTEYAGEVARLIGEGCVIGLLNGRMEFGPRALGARSIIGDARSPQMQSTMNLKIKYRESFRPFAPSCLDEKKNDLFELEAASPYMLFVAPVRQERRRTDAGWEAMPLKQRVNAVRSDIPAVTHVDHSARVQTVNADTNSRYYSIIKAFEQRTGYGIIINTSFNVRGEPIVCTPEDAYRCFMRTEMDWLVMGNWLLDKRQQPEWNEAKDWRQDYVMD